jgi:hypothetical protein
MCRQSSLLSRQMKLEADISQQALDLLKGSPIGEFGLSHVQGQAEKRLVIHEHAFHQRPIAGDSDSQPRACGDIESKPATGEGVR